MAIIRDTSGQYQDENLLPESSERRLQAPMRPETPVPQPSPDRQDGDLALARTSARLNAIIFSAMDAIISVDAEQRIIMFNPAAEQMFGLPALEVLGQKLDRFVPERFRSAHSEHLEKYSESGGTRRRMGALGTISALRANGEEFPAEASISHVEVNGEKILTVIVRDISQRVRDERALAASEARKAAILESALDCILTIGQDGEIVEVNAASERIFGYRPEEMLGREMAELIIPLRLRQAHRQGFARYLATGQGLLLGKPLEFVALHKSGAEFPVELTLSSFRLGQQTFFTCALRDITERKRSETALNEAMEQLARAKVELEERVRERTAALAQTIGDLETFAYTLSHDLRAPLRAIRGLTRICLEDCATELSPDGKELLERVIGAAERMDRLMQDLPDVQPRDSGTRAARIGFAGNHSPTAHSGTTRIPSLRCVDQSRARYPSRPSATRRLGTMFVEPPG